MKKLGFADEFRVQIGEVLDQHRCEGVVLPMQNLVIFVVFRRRLRFV
jgi:hypothetical protein